MGFVTSIILIDIFGFFSHYFYRKYGIRRGRLGWIFYYSIFIVGWFLIMDILTYFGVFDFIFPFFNIIPWSSIENGRDLMWNSFQLFGIDWNIDITQNGLNNIALLLFCSYPVWFKFFKDFSRKIFGGNRRRPYERGYSFLFTSRISHKGDKKKVKSPRKV
jgi:hypothetical protein